MSKDEIRAALIRGGVNNLGEYGYLNVRPENILTDLIYASFFKSMLESNLAEVGGRKPDLDAVINELIAECEQTIKAAQ